MLKYTFLTIFLLSLSICSSSAQYRIVFSSDRAGNSDLYIMDSGGTAVQQLTADESPEWSPVNAGSDRISFLRETDSGIKRFTVTAGDGTVKSEPQPGPCMLDDKNVQYGPVTGRWLFFCRNGIYIGAPDGTGAELITGDFQGSALLPVWSPDEQQVIFTGNAGGNKEIYALELSTGKFSNLTDHPANDNIGDLSPDSRFLLFTSDRGGGGNQDLYIRDLDTGKDTNITDTPNWELIGRWSPDGKFIVFGSNRDGNWELYRYEVKTGETVRLTHNDAFDGDPRFLAE